MYKRMLLPTDGSPCSEQTVRWGLNLAKILGAEVTFLHVVQYNVAALYGVPTGGFYVADLERDLQDAGRELLARAKAQATELGVTCDVHMIEDDHPAQAILRAEDTHDLTVMATHSRRGLDRLFLGSVTEAVLRRSDKPHLILGCPAEDTPEDQVHVPASFEHLLLPTDGSACSDHALDEGLELAKALGAKVTILHAVEVPFTVYAMPDSMVYEPSIREDLRKVAQDTLDKALSQAAKEDVEATIKLVDSGSARPDQAILDAEALADLTIMGTHGRRGFDRALLGSVTGRVLRRSPAPHLVLRCPNVEGPA